MTYDELEALVIASHSLEGILPIAVADALAGALRRSEDDTALTAAVAAFELARQGCTRDLFLTLVR